MSENTPLEIPNVPEGRPMPGSMELPYDVSNPNFQGIASVDVTTFPQYPGQLFVCVRSAGTTLQGTMDADMMEKVGEMFIAAAKQQRSGLSLPNGSRLILPDGTVL